MSMLNRKKSVSVVIAGGGTGGHLFPGIGLADAILDIDSSANITFIVPGKKVDKKIMSATNFAWFTNPLRSPFGGINSKLSFIKDFFKSLKINLKVFKKNKPDVIIGLGGYGCFTTNLIAYLYSIPFVMLEANRIPGKVVKLFAKISNAIYSPGKLKYIENRNVKELGLPLRKEFSEIYTLKNEITDLKNILIMGGSLGAKCINESVKEMLPLLEDKKEDLEFTHLCGRSEETRTSLEKFYKNYGYKAEVLEFSHNIYELYLKADLVICRAGGSSLAEILALGIPSIIIPYALAADNHQVENGAYIESHGAAVLVEEKNLSGKLIASKISVFIENKSKFSDMALKAKSLGRPNSSKDIAEDIFKILMGTKR